MTDFACTHAKVSTVEPGGDDSLIQSTDWNAEHSVPADYVEMFEGLLLVWKKLVLPYTGTVASIPAGWQLCDGTNGTYDLRDKFLVGAKQDDSGTAKTNVEGSLKQSASPTHTHTGPSHTHDVSGTTGTASYPAVNRDSGGTAALTPQMSHTHSFSDTSTVAGTGATGAAGTGATGAEDAIPPYFALAFIQYTG